MARILIINGHPDPSAKRFCAAVAHAYDEAAKLQGDHTRHLQVGALTFPLIRSSQDFEQEPPPPDIAHAQDLVRWADHLVIVLPLWLGGVPAFTKGFFEQLFRPQFAVRWRENALPAGLLAGTSVRLIVTMGMPAMAFRLAFGAFGIRAFESVLRLTGLHITGRTLIGGVGDLTPKAAAGWLKKVAALPDLDI